VDASDLDDDEAALALSAGLVIGDEAIADEAALGHHRVVAGRDDPVFQRDGTDAQGREEMGEDRRHCGDLAASSRLV
jgi:hypothetical protein